MLPQAFSPKTLAALKNSGMLTAGESEKFTKCRSATPFVREALVRFDLHPAAAEQRELMVNAQLLKSVRQRPWPSRRCDFSASFRSKARS